MNYVGIIAEYNPFHSGHRHQIAQTRKKLGENTTILVIMSGNWVQQAYCAITDKWQRASFAIEGGADLVIELPTPWAVSSAQKFARGAIAHLEATGLITHLSFGSEQGELQTLQTMVEALEDPRYPTLLKEALKTGISFPTARQQALQSLIGEGSHLLEKPNNTLGLEYLSALYHSKSTIKPLTILREGGAHNSLVSPEQQAPIFTSATDLRAKILENNTHYLEQYLSPSTYHQFLPQIEAKNIPTLAQAEKAILATLYSMTAEDWSKLPDSGIGEGLPHRLEKIARSSQSVAHFLELGKTKRYTHARLRRLVLSAYLHLPAQHEPPSYLRILAMSQNGTQALKQMKQTATLPIVNKPAQIHHLSPDAQSLFQREVRATDLYGLCYPNPPSPQQEWLQSPKRPS